MEDKYDSNYVGPFSSEEGFEFEPSSEDYETILAEILPQLAAERGLKEPKLFEVAA